MSFLEPAKETLFMLGKTKTSCLWSILAPIQFWAFWGIKVYFLDFLKDFCFTFPYKEFANLSIS